MRGTQGYPRVRGRLLVPTAVALALVALLVVAPSSPLRVPLALAAALWAPGDAMLGLRYRGRALNGVERFALACALGLATAPILGLVVSIVSSLTAMHLALGVLTEVLALTVAAFLRAPPPAIPAPPMPVPSTRATFAIAGAALAVSAGLFLWDMRPVETPASLAIADASGNVSALPATLSPGAAPTFDLTLSAGGAARNGTLLVTLDNGTLLRQAMPLEASRTRDVAIPLPPLATGDHELVARWAGREVHLWLHVREMAHA